MRLFKPKTPKPNDDNTDASRCPKGSRETQILGHLERFGWLTMAQIAALLFHANSPDPHAKEYKQTRKILNRLHTSSDLYIRVLPNNTRAYLLTERGANRLTQGTDRQALHGENILTTHPILDKETSKPRGPKSMSSAWIHRWVTNQFIIQNGLSHAITEVDIFRGKVPFPIRNNPNSYIQQPTRSWNGKAPDALLYRYEDGVKLLTWVEIENARRRTGDYIDSDTQSNRGGLKSLAIWLANAFFEDVVYDQVRIEKVIFVIVTSAETSHRLMRFMTPIVNTLHTLLESRYKTDFDEKRQMIYSRIEVQEYVVGKGPRLMEVRLHNPMNTPQTTLIEVDQAIELERMQQKKGKPRIDGKIKV